MKTQKSELLSRRLNAVQILSVSFFSVRLRAIKIESEFVVINKKNLINNFEQEDVGLNMILYV